jgi:hypothetical protein
MIYHLIAILYLVVNGQAATEPTVQLRNYHDFPTEEACMNHMDTPAGLLERQQIDVLIKQQGEPYKVEFKCVGAPDNSL